MRLKEWLVWILGICFGILSSCKSSRAFGSRNKAVMESSWVAENTLWIRERRKKLVELNVGSSLN
jgi:hypothetical protein